MRLERFGIVLRSMNERDLEMVRLWRNAPHVRENMDFQDEITSSMQAKWFENLDPNRDLYLIAAHNQLPFAVLHVKDIDWQNESGEAGIFVGEQAFLGSLEPVLAVLAMMDLVFLGFGLKRLFAKVRGDRPDIMNFNQQLGYLPLPRQEGKTFIRLKTNPTAYLSAAKVLRRQAFQYQTSERQIEIEEEVFLKRWKSHGEKY